MVSYSDTTVPQDGDEREPMCPEYIPLEDEHVLSAEEQPLPPFVLPTVEGDDGDDDDNDSSRDDTDDEDANEEDEDKEEHLAPADSAIVIPTHELVSPLEGTKPVIPPPSTNTTTTGARITVRLQAANSLPPEAEVERLLAMPTPPPSPLALLSPPSTGECLARCTAQAAYTQALIDAVTAAIPSPPLPPPLYIPPPIDRKDDIPEIEIPPRKRDRGIDYGFVSTLDAEARRQGIGEVRYSIRDTWVDPAETVPEIAPMTMRVVNTRVTKLAELHGHDTQDLYALLEDAQDRRTHIS
uniref:Uncharacterized protein n=1 Tax=Tanacetum cinerariifolium TaxID=118510 RepID=A0A699HJ23_TANCI|nr:hypothetical protein [Tanacetum cinerariifolium]